MNGSNSNGKKMDIFNLEPPPPEPIGTPIGVEAIEKSPRSLGQKLVAEQKRKRVINKLVKLKKSRSLKKKTKNTGNSHKSGKKKDHQRQDDRSPRKTVPIPDLDYQKLAAAHLTCSDITDPIYKKPFEYGWRRELVFRATLREGNQRLGDVYYYTPDGFRLRSMVELAQVELPKGLTLDNFSFFPEPTGVNNLWKETIRAAVFRDKESVAQTRQNVRERLQNVKGKLALNLPPRKKMRRWGNVHTRYETNNCDVDEEMADDFLTELRSIKTEKDCDYSPGSRIVIEYDNNQPIKLEKEFSFTVHHDETVKKRRDEITLQENTKERELNRLAEMIMKKEKDQTQQESLDECGSNRLPEIITEKEKGETQLQERREENESNRHLKMIMTNDSNQLQEFVGGRESCRLPEIPIKKEKDDTQLQEPLQELESSILKETEDKGRGETQHICLPNGQFKTTVKTCNKASQTLDESNDQAMLIDRLQMENLFLKEKLANLEKACSNQLSVVGVSKDASNVSCSTNVVNNKESEVIDSDSDSEVICVDEVVLNMDYESIDLDSD